MRVPVYLLPAVFLILGSALSTVSRAEVVPITIATGGVKGASTTANVEINIIDAKGRTSGWLKVGNSFPENKKKIAYKILKDIGVPVQVIVEHDGSGYDSDWFLEYIKIKYLTQETYFIAGQWIDARVPVALSQGAEKWCLDIKGDDFEKTKDILLSAFITGTKGFSGTFTVQNSAEDGLPQDWRGFCYWVKPIGTPTELRISNRATNWSYKSTWHMQKVCLHSDSTETPYYCYNRKETINPGLQKDLPLTKVTNLESLGAKGKKH